MLVSKPTHGGGAPLGIDLEAGVATIRIPAKAVTPPQAEVPADAADVPDPETPDETSAAT